MYSVNNPPCGLLMWVINVGLSGLLTWGYTGYGVIRGYIVSDNIRS